MEDFGEWVRVKQTAPYDNFFAKIKSIIQGRFPNAKILLFGSSAAFLAVQGSDIDILVHDQSESLPTLYHQTYEKLSKINRFV